MVGGIKNLIIVLSLAVTGFLACDTCTAAPSIEPGVDFELPWNDLNSADMQSRSELRRIASYMPSGMRSSGDFNEVAQKMLEGTSRNFSESDDFKSSDLGRQVASIQSVVSPSLSIFGSDSESQSETTDNDPYKEVMPEDDIKHELEVQLDAPSSKAKLNYKGVLDASAEYSVSGDLDISFRKALDKSTSIRMVHHTSTAESLLSVDVRF